MFASMSLIEPDKCSICHEQDMKEGCLGHENGKVLHVFHEQCLRSTIESTQGTPLCPLCREKITHINGMALPERSNSTATQEFLLAAMEKCVTIGLVLVIPFWAHDFWTTGVILRI